jgi:hypothetical protein
MGMPPGGGIASRQMEIAGLPVGERIALWAESFVGTPYDPDPLGEYVRREVIVADERVDCMYHTFRSVELAVSNTPEDAVRAALGLRFREAGALVDGKVSNYDTRFEYAVDMLRSGKWGRDVTAELAATIEVPGARGHKALRVISGDMVKDAARKMKSGDIVYFIKHPSRRVVGEIVGHLGIIRREGGVVYLIHASGKKKQGGEVRKLPLTDYAADMPFLGIAVGRF